MTRVTARSASHSSRVRASAPTMAWVSALSAAGRFRVTMPAVPRRSNRMSVEPPGNSWPSSLSEHPGCRISDRAVFVQQQRSLDDSDQRPDEPPRIDNKPDQDKDQDGPDHEIQNPDPEGIDLEAIVRIEHGIPGAEFDMGDDHTNHAGDAGKICDEVEHVDHQRDGRVGKCGLTG